MFPLLLRVFISIFQSRLSPVIEPQRNRCRIKALTFGKVVWMSESTFYVLHIRRGEAFSLRPTWGNADPPHKKAGRDEGMGAALGL